jgi:tetratricopeptide (TPR) repeat protein
MSRGCLPASRRWTLPVCLDCLPSCLGLAEMNEETLAVGQLVVRSLPDRPEAHAQMALANLQVGLDRAALESWQKAWTGGRDVRRRVLGNGTIFSRSLGEDEAAIVLLRKAIALNPELEAAYQRADRGAASLAGHGRSAGESRATACGGFLTDAEHALLGRAKRSCNWKITPPLGSNHEQAIRIDPEYTPAYHSLAIACARLGEKDQAKQYQQKFRGIESRRVGG